MARRYTAKLDGIYPSISDVSSFKKHNLLFPISYANPNYYSSALYAIVDWINQSCQNVHVLEVGYLYRSYFRLFSETMGEAISVAEYVQEHYREDVLMPCLAKFSQTNFQFIRFSDIANQKDYHRYYQLILKLIDQDPSIKTMLDAESLKFVEKRYNDSEIIVDKIHALQLSREFLIEEMALILSLAALGFDGLMYPGAPLSCAKYLIDHSGQAPLRVLQEFMLICLKLTKHGAKFNRVFSKCQGLSELLEHEYQ